MKRWRSNLLVYFLTLFLAMTYGKSLGFENYIVESRVLDQESRMKLMFEKGNAEQLMVLTDSLLSIQELPLNERLLAIHFKGMALQSPGRYNELIRLYKASININKPDSLIYWDIQYMIGLHDIYIRLGASAEAISTINRAEPIISSSRWKNVDSKRSENIRFSLLMSKSVFYQTNGEWEKALGVIENYHPVHLSETLRLMLESQKAILFYKTGRMEDAERWFEKVCRNPVNNPNKLAAIIYYGEMLNLQGRSPEAALLLDNYVELAKSVTDTEIIRDYLMIRAHVLRELGREREANEYYNQLLVVDDTLHKIHREAMESLLADKISSEKVEELNENLGYMRWSVTVGIVGGVVLLMLMGLIIWIYVRHKRTSSDKIRHLMSTIDRSDSEYRSKIESIEKEIEDYNTKLQTSVIQLSKLDSGLKTIQEELNTPNKSSDERIAAIRLNILEVAKESDNAERYNLLATKESKRLVARLIALHPNLTKSELEICCYISKGLSTKDMALLTGRSPRTVEALKYSLRKKLSISIPTDAYIRSIAIEGP